MMRSAQSHEGGTNQPKSESEGREPNAFSCHTKLNRILVASVAAMALVCAPQAALAQHGGGGHGGGGGHSGGMGGGHWGGGNSGGLGHSTSHAPVATVHGSGSPASTNTQAGRPPAFEGNTPSSLQHSTEPWSFAPPRPSGSTAGSGVGSVAEEPVVPQHQTIGFPPVDSASGFATPEARVAGAAGWRPIAPAHGALSFSGQGHEIWQDEPKGAGEGTGALESRSLETQRPHPISPRRFHGWGFGGPGYGYGYGWDGFYPWGLGFGFGTCDLLWDFNCGAYLGNWNSGYGYYGPNSGLYLDSSSDNGGTDSSSLQDYGTYENTAPESSPQDSANGTTVIYLNDGTSFTVTDYWVSDYQLHYVTDGVRENAVNLDQIDVQRTVDENAARGVSFTLKPAPSAPRN